MTKEAPYKGPGADSEEKHEPASDIDTVLVDSLKALDPNPPIREADILLHREDVRFSRWTNLVCVNYPLRSVGHCYIVPRV